MTSVGAGRRGWLLALALLSGCATDRAVHGAQQALAKLLAAPELAGARVGVLVLDLAEGRRWCAHAAEQGFATASNLKLVSAAVGLQTLGPEHRFATELWQTGSVQDGVLQGDLVLRGGGDPACGGPTGAGEPLPTFLQAVQQAGIRAVAGRVVGDGSWLGPEVRGLGWQWDYLDEDYAAPFGGLVWAGSLATFRVRPGPSGAPVCAVAPEGIAAPELAIRPVPARQPSVLALQRPLGASTFVVRGTLAADAREAVLRGAVHDPAAFAAEAFAAALQRQQVAVARFGTGALPAAAAGRRLARHDGPPLRELLGPLLGDSNNLHAELVYRGAARAAGGDGGTAAAERHAKQVLQGLGVDPAGMVLADGSGLSRRNLVRPRQFAELLAAMWRSPHREPFLAALPQAGRTGTLSGRFRSGPAHGRVRAKTGYIARVVCLSGYVTRPGDAAPVVFSVLLNDFTCSDAAAKAAVDGFVQELAGLAEAPAPPDHAAAAPAGRAAGR